MKRNAILIAAALFVMPIHPASPDDLTNAKIDIMELRTDWIKGLLSGNPDKERGAAEEAIKERKQITATLSSIIKEPEDKSNRAKIASAIKIAGIIRAAELVDVLVDKIDFLEYGVHSTFAPYSPVNDCIAVESLIKIGKTSVQPIIKRLAKEKDNNNRIRCLFVVYKVEGEEFTKIILQKAIQKADGEDKKNLEKAMEESLKLIENIK